MATPPFELITDVAEVWPVLQELAPPAVDGHNVQIEYVAAEIAADRAMCLRSADGVLLLVLQANLQKLDLELNVWVAASTGPPGMIDRYLPVVEQIARDVGAARVVMQSPRLGWLRALPERWRVTMVTYECEVQR